MEARRILAKFVRDRPWLWDLIHPTYHRLRNRVREARIRRAFGGRLASSDAAGQTLLSEAIGSAIRDGRPFAAGKVGGLEAEAAGFFLGRRGQGESYPRLLRAQMGLNVGLFPDDDASIDRFCAALVEAAGVMDVMGVLGFDGEPAVLGTHAPSARLVPAASLDPWWFPDPWTRHLAGRRVCVVSPFAATIARQHGRLAAVWPGEGHAGPAMMPEFDLRVVRMPLSPGLVPPSEPDWWTRYERVRDAVEGAPYDVLLAGAGGISILLAAHAKRTGRVGFHTGGPTQVLFGVRGRRWDDDPAMRRFINDSWVRPDAEDTPAEAWRIERGCYW